MTSLIIAKAAFTKAEDYDDWNRDFIAKARALDLWEFIDPTGRNNWPTKPMKPDITKYPKKNTVKTPTSSADLTTEGKTSFGADLSIYVYEDKDYKEHRRKVTELTAWMQDTIASHYRSTLLDAEKEIDEWYDSIRKIGLATQSSIKQEARSQYKAIVSRPLPKVPKDLGAWVTKWESTVAKGIEKGLTELKAPDNLMSDLEFTLQGVIPDWTTSFRMINDTAIEAGTLTYY
ncbi:hypothetical protein F4824DRAFT_483681 [Ustulina deusta]|nr:hypothetical protein F4824DRAFT_483681 [Ustulina deusta]